MPVLYAPIRLHSQASHRFGANQSLILTMSYEGTYPKILVLQPNRREQRHLRGRSTYMKVIGQMDARVWHVIMQTVNGADYHPRIGQSMLHRLTVTVARNNIAASAAIRARMPPHLRNIRNTVPMLTAPFSSHYDDHLIVRIGYT